jgi:NAD+ diphosphatase
MVLLPPANLALARGTVDRASRLRMDDRAVAALWADEETRVLRVHEGETLVAGDPPELVFGIPANGTGERFLLGLDGDGRAYFAVAEAFAAGPGQRSANLRTVGALLSDRDVGLFVHAVALDNWHGTHTHCARCGARTVVAAGGHIRRCPGDGSEHFPRTDPAVIMLITDTEDRALLGRQHSWPARRFSTLAGFVEPGESAEQAVAREVREEAGVEVGEVRYFASQPWPFPSSLMLGFYGRAVTTEIVLEDELAEARWFTRDVLVSEISAGSLGLPPSVSIARRLIEGWYGGEILDE